MAGEATRGRSTNSLESLKMEAFCTVASRGPWQKTGLGVRVEKRGDVQGKDGTLHAAKVEHQSYPLHSHNMDFVEAT